MDEELIKNYSSHVERTAWIVSFFGMLTQVSAEYAFPSYNVVLGFWGAYCAFSKHGRATFGYICFLFLSIFLDIVYCSLYGSEGTTSSFKFALTMLVFSLITKLAALYSASHFFSALGGAHSMETSMGQSAYDSLAYSRQSTGDETSYYAPPLSSGDRRKKQTAHSFHDDDDQDEIGSRDGGRRDPGIF